ncbi:unnamed protein product [Kuraishia capsulata CBS 1993]|uniref:arginine--tRNA ligase n=1 Tax=Kuraishia capsulata CBS 1993 TaxID=1382522 RepID=W6MRC0_9ASCO|nr:uncharacterized protein KUCA_T00004898001 [Kuraishia capsulata CBS 1993]CDK28913.1 unnamed protein product [Kuraishia capsulata CBS 1993]
MLKRGLKAVFFTHLPLYRAPISIYSFSSKRYQRAMSTSVGQVTASLQKLNLEVPPAVEGSYPDGNIVDLGRNYITKHLAELTGVDAKIVFPALEWSTTLDKGDLLVALPRLRLKGDLNALAEKIASDFPLGGYLSKVVPQGKFLQFWFDDQMLLSLVTKEILDKGAQYGSAPIGVGKKIIVEFSSPNIAKPFHAGHLRSTIIGGFLSNLYEKLGWDVVRLNYLGDWGKQFGVLAVGFAKYGSEEKLADDPIDHLFQVYVAINNDIKAEKEAGVAEADSIDEQARAFFKKLSDGDQDAYKLWAKFRDLSIERYIDTYARLNIKFDSYSGESQVPQELMEGATKTLREKGLITEDRGALLVDLAPFDKKLGKVLVQKTDGTSLYLTRDIGAATDRKAKYNFDKMIYVIASQQDLHVKQFFKILDLMGYEWANPKKEQLLHVNFGMVLGMSTRAGTVVFLNDILNTTKEKMLEIMKRNEDKYAQVEDAENVADLIGIAAVMIQDMSAKRVYNYEFSWDRMLSFEGDTGPYLQYAHSRLKSIERLAGIPEEEYLNAKMDLAVILGNEPKESDFPAEEYAKELEAYEYRKQKVSYLVKVLSQYPDSLRFASKNSEPSTVVTYLFKLAHQFSSTYKVLRVVGEEHDVMLARLTLFACVRQTLSNGLLLLGITPVDRM